MHLFFIRSTVKTPFFERTSMVPFAAEPGQLLDFGNNDRFRGQFDKQVVVLTLYSGLSEKPGFPAHGHPHRDGDTRARLPIPFIPVNVSLLSNAAPARKGTLSP